MLQTSKQGDSPSNDMCQFDGIDIYIDIDSGNKIPYKCDEKAISSGLCMFHHPTYWQKKPDRLVHRLLEKIASSKSANNSNICCIGYNLPSITIAQDFSRNMYFTSSKFHGKLRVEGCIFKIVDFSKSVFYDQVFFKSSMFFQKSSFSDAVFKDAVYFDETLLISCSFSGVRFDNAVTFHKKACGSPLNHEETSFSSLKASNTKEVYFTECLFNNKTSFSNSMFFNRLKFEKTYFMEEARFSNIKFMDEGTIYFEEVKCRKQIVFSYASFLGKYPYFSNCTFQNTKFNSCLFNEGIFFNKVNFGFVGLENDNGITDFSYSNFNGRVFFTNVKFYYDTTFRNAEFSEKAIASYSDSIFLQPADFSYVKFNADLHFRRSIFYEKTDFSHAICGNNSYVNFNQTTFLRQADFSNCIFDKKIFFENNTTFRESIAFDGTVFNQVEFTDVIFKGNIIFDNALIKTNLDFVRSRFTNDKLPIRNNKIMSLISMHFQGKANFRNVIFSTKIKFRNAKFDDYSIVNFDNVNFLDEVDFSNVRTTSGSVLSFRASFYKNTDFRYALFGSEVRFEETIFYTHTNWSYAKLGESIFRNVTFNEVDFQGANFERAIFENVNFSKTANFKHAFFKTAIFSVDSSFKEETEFKFVTFEDGNRVHFDHQELSYVSFMNTDISRIHFKENLVWGRENLMLDERNLEKSLKYAEALQYIFNEGGVDITKYEKVDVSYDDMILHILIDRGAKKLKVRVNDDNKMFVFAIEKSLNNTKIYSTVSIGGIKAIYRSLRQNYDYWFRHEEADEAYMKEMEIQRKYREVTSDYETKTKRNGFVRKNFSLTGLYRHMASYGLDYKRPVIISAIIIAIPILYAFYEFSLESEHLDGKGIFDIAIEKFSGILGIEKQELTSYLIEPGS